MATNMAPHNLVEVIGAARHLIAHPDLLARRPDEVRARARTCPAAAGSSGSTASGTPTSPAAAPSARGPPPGSRRSPRAARASSSPSCPTSSAPRRSSRRSRTSSRAKRLQGIADVKDLTDRTHGMQLVIEVKNGFNPEAVLEQLYRLTPMEESFSINNVALVDGQPRTLGLKELLKVYVDFRTDVVRRRTAYRLARREERLHLVEGLLVAILDIDEVIQLIRGSDDAATARARLIDVFDLSEVQADLHPRPAAAPADQVLPHRAGEREGRPRAPDRGAAGHPRRREAAAAHVSDRARRGRQGPRHARAARCCWSRPVRPASPRAARCRSRSPTTRAGCCSRRPGCSPGP